MTDSTWKDDHAQHLFIYERLMARSIQTNSMQWQAPSLALAAQAFLLTVALRADSNPGNQREATLIVCSVGVVITIMAWQLMARHRYYFHLDQADMDQLERDLSLMRISNRECQRDRRSDVRFPWLGGYLFPSSFRFWQAGFLFIILTDVYIATTAYLPFRGGFIVVLIGIASGLLSWWGLYSALSPIRASRGHVR
jgi:hypothetical protein